MEKFDSKGAVTTFAGDRDKLSRSETGVRLRITARASQLVGGGHMAHPGVSEVTMPRKEVLGLLRTIDPAFDGEIEPGLKVTDDDEPKRIAEAEAAYEVEIDRLTAEAYPEHKKPVITAARTLPLEVARRTHTHLTQKLVDEIMARREEVRAQSGMSVMGVFYRDFDRGVNPLISIEVLGTHLNVQEDRDSAIMQAAMMQEAVRMLRRDQGAGGAPEGFVRVEDVEAIVARKLEEFTSGSGKGKK